MMSEQDGWVLRIRGLPWQATREEILEFFDGCMVHKGLNGIFMTLSREGRPSGEAYVEMETEDDFNKGLEKNRNHMGTRYIEVFASKKSEMDWICRKQGADGDGNQHSDPDSFLRLRGLPFNCNRDDILQFFSGLDLVMDGIVMPTDHSGRSTGEAYIQFASRDIAEKAMSKHKDKIGHRYIEIFKSSFQEFRAVRSYMDSKHYSGNYNNGPPQHGPPSSAYSYHKMRLGHPARAAPYPDRFRGGPYGAGNYNSYGGYGPPISGASRGPPPPGASRRVYDYDDMGFRGRSSSYGGRYPYDTMPPHERSAPITPYMGRHVVHMRGLPYKTTEGEIYEFFLPLRPLNVRILFDDLGRASGECDVEFATHDDAVKAMNKDKAYIQKRYIELFLHSTAPSNRGPSPRSLPPNPFSDGMQRYGSGPNMDNGHHHRLGPMGGWDSSIINDDIMRSRV